MGFIFKLVFLEVFLFMTKSDFVEQVAKELKISRKEVERHLHVVMHTLVDSIKREKKFRFLNFGTFSIVTRKARKGVNPRTGSKVEVPAKEVLRFKPSKTVAEEIAK